MKKKKFVSCIALLLMIQVICLADLGDVNVDGVVNHTDASEIENYLFFNGSLSDEDAADVNLDGIIDIADPIYIRSSTLLPGDVDGNNVMDMADIFLFMDYLLNSTIPIDNINASVNVDNKLDFGDLSGLIQIYFGFVRKRWNGDVNGDYVLDHADSLAIRQYHIGLYPFPFDPAYADINSDGNIDIIDAILIVQLLLDNDYCLGDVDGDNDVDLDDLKDLIKDFDQHSMIEYNPAKDVNEDRFITYADLIALARIVFKTGDVNCDGSVDIVDALLVAQYYVGIIPSLPTCP